MSALAGAATIASTEPVGSSAPNSSRTSSEVSGWETRFLTASVATAARTRLSSGTVSGLAALIHLERRCLTGAKETVLDDSAWSARPYLNSMPARARSRERCRRGTAGDRRRGGSSVRLGEVRAEGAAADALFAPADAGRPDLRVDRASARALPHVDPRGAGRADSVGCDELFTSTLSLGPVARLTRVTEKLGAGLDSEGGELLARSPRRSTL